MAQIKMKPGSSPVNEGERKTIEFLKENLPKNYTIIPNLQIIQSGQPPLDYDAVVIAPHAIYVIETKDWHGKIEGDDHEWKLNGEIRTSPYGITNRKAQVLKSELERRVMARPWVQAVIIVVDERTTLQLRGNVKQWTATLPDAPALLSDRQTLNAKINDLRRDHTRLVNAVLAAAGARQHPVRSFGDYRAVETVSIGDTVSEYKAINTALGIGNDTYYRLRVFAYDPYLSPDQLAQRSAMMRRDALALQQIGNHPNIITLRGFFTDTLDPNLFVAVLDWTMQPTLRDKLKAHQSGEQRLSNDALLEITLGVLRGLEAAHRAGIIHRDVRPENIHFDEQGIPLLVNFDYAKILSANNITLQGIPRQPDSPRQYMPPELAALPYHATFASDMYGVGVILYEFFVGQAFFDSPEQAREENTILSPKAVGVDIPDALDNLIQRLAHPDPAKRPKNATEVILELERIIAAVRPEPSVESEPAVFTPGDVIDGEYQVLEVLGGGGSGQMYKVYQALPDAEFALKVFHPASFALTAVQREIRALLDINKRNHPHIVKVVNAKTLPSGRYYLVSEFVKGKNLTHYTKFDETRLPVQQSVQLIEELLSALEAIHPDVEQMNALRERNSQLSAADAQRLKELEESGWIHRDIKPANLILSPEGIKLVDFNIAVRATEAGRTYIGTPEYMMPGVGSKRWETDADLFAVGIVLYELVTGYHPYPNRQPALNVSPQSPLQYIPNLHPHFVDLMLRAVSDDPERRFRSAKQFRSALEALQGIYFTPMTIATPHEYEVELEDWERGKANYNPYVTRLLRLYSQAVRDNSGTRGFDQIAQLTYVRTRLDSHLGEQVLAGKHRLVIITGNAGDGKTAFIQSLEAKVKQHKIEVHKPTENASTFIYEGRTFLTNYDGSQDEGEERANDLVLGEFFLPFNDESIDLVTMMSSVYIIAINQGRLLDFFSAASNFKQLGQLINDFFDPPSETYTSPDWLLVVDLNQRSMVAADPEQKNKSVFERQLEALLHPALWDNCNGCALRQRCFIKYNVDVLSDTASGSVLRERLQTLFEIVHLRRQLHITMRDMRSALAWMLLRDHNCDDVEHVLQQGSPQEQLSLLFYNAFAVDSTPPPDRTDDRLVRLLREIDPAQVANPTLDRELDFYGLSRVQRVAFEKRTDDLPRGIANTWKTSLDQMHPQISTETGQYTAEIQRYVRTLRRVAYFERRDDGWVDMLPYRKLALFRQAARGQNTDELKITIANGISIIEGAGRQVAGGNEHFIFVRAGSQSKVRLKSFRLFPLQEFAINIPGNYQGKAVEYTPDRIVFYYDFRAAGMNQTSQRPPELHLSLDLLEMLYQAEEGYVLSTDDLGGVAIYLNMFKNALAHLPYKTIRLQYEEGLQFNLIHEDAAVLRLSQIEDGDGQE